MVWSVEKSNILPGNGNCEEKSSHFESRTSAKVFLRTFPGLFTDLPVNSAKNANLRIDKTQPQEQSVNKI
jgi:hypothetical protein